MANFLVTCVEFASFNFSIFESDGLLEVTIKLSGQTQSQSFSVIVIAEANNSLSPAATGIYLFHLVAMYIHGVMMYF